ncbi:hypothetical protein K432DRAFT_430786 [Lepidopterella palustris CBS 459.81]|uniref:DUF6604 domain-containing protein n=1 Tax=Lepidopterella palustris CBS 459.81 TaxID=1314670 RepID=A0A8E2DWQ8_9PEZI|nr:hypothetical protein K432DRAFT_430786 [Lepidopterella palustris CBS 459.81]
MLPDFMVNTYRQYKADTNAIATWLANTAKKCGFSSDILTASASAAKIPSAPSAFVPTRKQRMRQAQRAAKAGPKSKYIIAVKDFVALAHCIASYKPPVNVTAEFAATLDRAIAVRKEHAAFYSGFSDEEKAKDESDQGHIHFIGILEEVQAILRPLMSVEVLKCCTAFHTRSESPTSGNLGPIHNLFQSLVIEEPSNDFLPPSGLATAETSKSKEPEYEVEHIHELEEVFLAIYGLFRDLNHLRTFISRTWAEYNVGSIDLIAASVATNTAIDFARHMEEEFAKAFSEYADARKVINLLYVAQCVICGEDPMYKQHPDDCMNFKMYDAGCSAFLPTFILLSSFAGVLEVHSTPIMKPGFYGNYDASSDRKAKSPRDKFLEDKIILLEALPDFFLIAKGTQNSIPGEDEFTRGLRMFFKDKTISLWLAFAAQIFLDINHSLREDVGGALVELQLTGKNIEATLNENFAYHEKLSIENWPKSNDRALLDIRDRINAFVKVDPIANAKRLLGVRGDVPSKPFLLYERHPLLCGLMTFSLKALFQETGIAFANAWGSILYASHIYNATCREKFIEKDWIDMEMAISLHGTEKFFVGDRPRAIDEYFKRYCLSMGYSAANFAKNKRKGLPIVSKAGPRGLGDLSPVSQMFKDRFCHPNYRTVRVDMTAEDVQRILDKAVIDNYDSNDDKTSGRPNRGQPELPIENIPKEHTQLHKQWEQYHLCTPVQLLCSLRDAIQQEVFELTFDHFRLHRMCWSLLRMIKEKLDDDLKRLYGPGYIEREDQLPFVVGYILMTATNTKSVAGLLLPKKNGEVTSELLRKAAEEVRSMIDSGAGGLCLKFMRESWGMNIECEFD